MTDLNEWLTSRFPTADRDGDTVFESGATLGVGHDGAKTVVTLAAGNAIRTITMDDADPKALEAIARMFDIHADLGRHESAARTSIATLDGYLAGCNGKYSIRA